MKYLLIFLAALTAIASPTCAYAQQPTQVVGPQTLNTGQVTVGTTTPTLILPSRPYRQRTTVIISAANQCYFGGPTVSATTGMAPAPVAGASFQYDNASPLYGLCPAAATTISFMEGY